MEGKKKVCSVTLSEIKSKHSFIPFHVQSHWLSPFDGRLLICQLEKKEQFLLFSN
jgi:hypothetical protein